MQDIREEIKNIIDGKGYVHAAIASKAGMSPTQLSGVLNKRRKLEAGEFLAVCAAIDTSPESFIMRKPAGAGERARRAGKKQAGGLK